MEVQLLQLGAIAAVVGAMTWGATWVAPGLFAMLISTSTLVFLGYGILFSTPAMANAYKRLHRIFDATFGLFFGAVAAKILTADLQN